LKGIFDENTKEMEEIVCKINKLVSFINESKRLHENFKRISQCVSDENEKKKSKLFSKIFQFPIFTTIMKFKK
jgi:predicted KAP-like P-loop ATPase